MKTKLLGIAIIASFLLVTGISLGAEIDTVILTTNANYPDTVVSSAVSQKLGIPVLLTDQAKLPEETTSALSDLNPKEVVLIGGPEAVSDKVVQELKDKGYKVTRLWGMTRYGTATEVAAHFWPEGVSEAILVENKRNEKKGNILSMAKNLANGKPILPIPEGKIPAKVLSQLNELDVREVKIIGTEISDEMKSDLEGIGVQIKEKVQARNEKELQEKLRNRTRNEIGKNDTLVVVATGGYKDTIAAPNLPQSKSFLVFSEEEISEAVNAVKDRGVNKVKVVGKPSLAEKIADTLKNETDAEIDLVVKRAAQAVGQAASLAKKNKPNFVNEFQNKHAQWQQRVQAAQRKIKQNANNSIDKVKTLIQDRNATELQVELQEARQKFSQGEFQEALESAREIRQELRENRWEAIRGNWTAVHKEVEDEAKDLREKTQELSEINREFGQEMSENMTVEERLETIKEFRERKREKIKEIMKEARKMRRRKGEEMGDWLEKAEREAEKKIEVEVEGGVAKVELEVNGTERKFQLNTTNRGEIIAEIARETGLEQGTIGKNLEMETEKEREVNETERGAEEQKRETGTEKRKHW